MKLPDRKSLKKRYVPGEMVAGTRAKPELAMALGQAAVKPHTYLYAPSGFGKTDTVRVYLTKMQCEKEWLALAPDDNWPDMFFMRLALAFLSLQPENAVHAKKLEDLSGEHIARCCLALTEEAAKSVRAAKGSVCIVLDSFENITDQMIIRELVKLMRVLPPDVSFIIIGKQEPHGSFSDLILRNMISVICGNNIVF